MTNKVLDGVFGLCIGDALGVPVEFKSRSCLAKNPVKDMIGYGTHNQPPGTWSDDSSLAFCYRQFQACSCNSSKVHGCTFEDYLNKAKTAVIALSKEIPIAIIAKIKFICILLRCFICSCISFNASIFTPSEYL